MSKIIVIKVIRRKPIRKKINKKNLQNVVL